MATYARILPRISSRNKELSPKDKQQNYHKASRIFDDMKNLVQQAEKEADAQNFTDSRPTYQYKLAMCLIWKCDIAARQYDWTFFFKEDLQNALAMLKFIEHGDYLPTRIAKICNSICYDGFNHFLARELKEFHDMGLKAYDEVSQCATTSRTAEITKAQMLLFKHYQDLFRSGEAYQDFFECILHKNLVKNKITKSGKRAFMKHMRYHYCTPVGESDQKARDILSRVRDITQAVDERSLHRVFSQNLSVLIITRFRLGESAASLKEYVQGRDMNTRDSAGIKLSLGRFHHYEYRLNNQQSSLEKAKKLYADAGKIHWEAEELLKALSSYARIN